MSRNSPASHVWRDLEDATGQSRESITSYLLEAAHFYETIADPSRDVAEYSVVDE